MQAFVDRRARLLKRMAHGIAVIPTAPERVRNRDSHHPYRHDSYFYYLSGFTEPDACLVLTAGEKPQTLLFCREKNPDREVWDGFRHGPDAAREMFRFDAAWPISDLDEKLAELLAGQPVLHYALGHDAGWDQRIAAALNRVRANARDGARAPAAIHDIRVTLDEMRLIKDEHEIADMRRAAAISAAAHRRAMRAAAPGRAEYEIEAELTHEFRRSGAQAPAYAPIVAGGANACVLHYAANSQPLRDGDLLLIDAGCEVDSYAADITRTFPVNGRFTPAQRDVYQLVLAAQRAAIAEIAPGKAWDAAHEAAVRALAQGMRDLKLLDGSVDGIIESGAYRRFYMHRTGHWLGLDVHDAGEYKRDGVWRPLAPGMTLTVEPGCYIRAADDVPPALWNIGVRIEDDALVTPSGCEILTEAAPKSVDAIEDWMVRAGAK
ncbi:MAG: aminopeptidase P N-terminal domain-containing protein [Zoogloeaceae bacterium]|jgi:Xaa-Pro aminopeptidase|nr:aminopeptidase P N-terminal domain-containing protein [Zoogloeaceae bacterium]